MTDVWSTIKIGALQLPHRLAMAPMTRSRAKPDGTPGDLAPECYARRATMGLLITEGTQPSEDGSPAPRKGLASRSPVSWPMPASPP
nr:hypothetical protein [Bosea sp. BE125]